MLRRLFIRAGNSSILNRHSKRVISTALCHCNCQPPSSRQLHHLPLGAPARRTSTISLGNSSSEKPFEEEGLPGYDVEQFYPVNIGDTIVSRYRVVGKLGYGANSTVWLCHDLTRVKETAPEHGAAH